jgi:hypothetical protein
MTKIRIALVSALAIASLLAGGVAAQGHTASAHNVAGPRTCCAVAHA